MVTKETAIKIYSCYREIEASKKLLNDMAEAKKMHEDPLPKDPFGRHRQFELGVPSGNNSTRLFNVNPDLAVSVINSHIGHQEAELKEANEQARIELEIN